MLRRFRTVTTALAAAVVLVACSGGEDPEAGPLVPDRELTTFEDDTTTLRDFTGEPLVVNFWASWCAPCIAEMPDFEEVHLDVAGEVRFIGVNTQDERENALQLVERTGVTYELVRDPLGDLFRDLEVFAMPTTFFVDADGAVVHRHSGLATRDQLRGLIDEHLLDPEPAAS